MIVREIDVTGDARPDRVTLRIRGRDFSAPLSWNFMISVDGQEVLNRTVEITPEQDTVFHHKEMFVGCDSYESCKRKFYFTDLPNNIVARNYDMSIFDRKDPIGLYRVGPEALRRCCGLQGEAADSILAAIERRFREGKGVAISIPPSIVISPILEAFSPELHRFIEIYEE